MTLSFFSYVYCKNMVCFGAKGRGGEGLCVCISCIGPMQGIEGMFDHFKCAKKPIMPCYDIIKCYTGKKESQH
jgi:hypothetical protein